MSKFQVRVVSVGSESVLLVKMLRLVADIGLLEAKGLSEYLRNHTPCVLVVGVSQEVADYAAALLRETGAEVVVEESSLEVPMLLFPKADQRYRWNWFGGSTPM